MNVLRPSPNSAFVTVSVPVVDTTEEEDTAQLMNRRIRFVAHPIFGRNRDSYVRHARLQERLASVYGTIKSFIRYSIRCCFPYHR